VRNASIVQQRQASAAALAVFDHSVEKAGTQTTKYQGADVENLALANDIVQAAHDFFHWCDSILDVHPVEVDVVGLPSFQSDFQCLHHVSCGDSPLDRCLARHWSMDLRHSYPIAVGLLPPLLSRPLFQSLRGSKPFTFSESVWRAAAS
jgi:hypothetical protein